MIKTVFEMNAKQKDQQIKRCYLILFPVELQDNIRILLRFMQFVLPNCIVETARETNEFKPGAGSGEAGQLRFRGAAGNALPEK